MSNKEIKLLKGLLVLLKKYQYGLKRTDKILMNGIRRILFRNYFSVNNETSVTFSESKHPRDNYGRFRKKNEELEKMKIEGLKYAAKGDSNREAGGKIYRSKASMKVYLEQFRDRFGLKKGATRTDKVVRAIEQGLIDINELDVYGNIIEKREKKLRILGDKELKQLKAELINQGYDDDYIKRRLTYRRQQIEDDIKREIEKLPRNFDEALAQYYNEKAAIQRYKVNFAPIIKKDSEEIKTLQKMGAGYKYGDIVRLRKDKRITYDAPKKQMQNIFQKLQLHNPTQAVIVALQNGIITLEDIVKMRELYKD